MLPVFKQFPDVCLVVPRFLDVLKKTENGFISNKSIFFHQFLPYSGKHEILQAIASGKVLKVSTLDKIGLMNEELFIDWVDLEWCWRARARGFKIIGNADVIIKHQLGEISIDLFFREVNLRSPMRHYYITRNAFYLALHSRDLDLSHRIILFIKSFRYIAGYPLLSKPHLVHLKAVLYGFYHGIVARLGRYDLD
jgi:rhamnosyltransferase